MNNLSLHTDHQLLDLIQSGKIHVFTELYNRYWDKLFAVAYNRLQNIEESEECVQDVFCKFWAVRKDFKLKNQSLQNYLAHSVRNQVFTVLSRRYRAQQKNEQLGHQQDIEPLNPERSMMLKELEQQFNAAIDALPAQCKLVFTMRRREGLSVDEIAEKLNISPNTVKSHLKKANSDLRDNLDLFSLAVLISLVIYR